MNILVLNCGSSSLKYQLINMDDESVIAKGLVERIGIEGSVLTHKPTGKDKYVVETPMKDHNIAVKLVLDALQDAEHGGDQGDRREEVTQVVGVAQTGTVVATTNLGESISGYEFGYWSLNGMRQADVLGVALSRFSFEVTTDMAVVAQMPVSIKAWADFSPSTRTTVSTARMPGWLYKGRGSGGAILRRLASQGRNSFLPPGGS